MILPNLNDKGEFSEKFLDEYLKNGLGSLSKKDIDLLVLKLLLDFLSKNAKQDVEIFQLSHQLKISITKLRNLIKEVQIRYNLIDEDIVKKRLLYIFEKNRWKVVGDYIHLSIIDPLIRDYFQELIYKENSFSDYSFNPEIIKIEKKVFSKIICNLSGKTLVEIEKSIPKNLSDQIDMKGITQSEVFIEKIININTNVEIKFDLGAAIGAFFSSLFK